MAPLEKYAGKMYIDNAGGTLTDVGGNGTKFRVSVRNQVGQYVTLNTKWVKRVDGPREWQVDIELVAETGTNGYSLLRDWIMADAPGARTGRFDQPDSQPGSLRFEGEVRVQNADGLLDADASVGEVVRVTSSLMGDGALTASVIV